MPRGGRLQRTERPAAVHQRRSLQRLGPRRPALHGLPRGRHRHPARAAQEGRHRALRHVPRRHRGHVPEERTWEVESQGLWRGGDVYGLPRSHSRAQAPCGPDLERALVESHRHLRALSRQRRAGGEIPYTGRAPGRGVPGERACARGRGRGARCGVLRLPRSPPHPRGHRSEFVDLADQHPEDVRNVPREGAGRLPGQRARRRPRARAATRPVCTDCHGEHRILGAGEPASPVFAANIPANLRPLPRAARLSESTVCRRKVSRLPGQLPRPGPARRQIPAPTAPAATASTTSAVQRPGSHVHPTNLAQTCGKCHRARAAVRPRPRPRPPARPTARRAVAWIRLVYLWLIGLIVGGMARTTCSTSRARRAGRLAAARRAGEQPSA